MKTSGYRGGLASDDHATHIRAAKRIASAIYYVLIHSFAKVLRTTSAKNSCSSSIITFPLISIYAEYATAMPYQSATVACPIWLQLYQATTKAFSIKNRSHRPSSLLATAANQQIALSMENRLVSRAAFSGRVWAGFGLKVDKNSGLDSGLRRTFCLKCTKI